MFAPEPLEALRALFPDVVSSQISSGKIEVEYGEQARLFMPRKFVQTVLQMAQAGWSPEPFVAMPKRYRAPE